MKVLIEENSTEISKLEEMTVKVYNSLPTEIENSIFYPKLKQLLHVEINSFCKEQFELKQELNIFRQLVGEVLSEEQIRSYLDILKEKYNNINTDVGLQYHIETTRIDISVCVSVVIKRNSIHMKQFIFRFRKSDGLFGSLDGLTTSGIPRVE